MTDAETIEAMKALADQVWRESQDDKTIIRDAGIMQDLVRRMDALLGTPER